MSKKLIVKNALIIIGLLAVAILVSGCSTRDASPEVKKSSTGICHEKGSYYYGKTKNFDAFYTIDDCLNSGGRLPKK